MMEGYAITAYPSVIEDPDGKLWTGFKNITAKNVKY